MSIHALADQTRTALSARLYFLALNTALVIPDICAALSSENGETTGKKYARWYDEWARPKFTTRFLSAFDEPSLAQMKEAGFKPPESAIDGKICYGYRCGVLHQGRSFHKYIPGRIIFTEKELPTDQPFHQNFANEALFIDIDEFCLEIIEGYADWYAAKKDDPIVVKNEDHSFKRYPNGMEPYAAGIPCSI